MKGQLELFPVVDFLGPEPDPRKIIVQHDPRYQYGGGWRWFCVRCGRGGMHGYKPGRAALRYAGTKHRCRPFATDGLDSRTSTETPAVSGKVDT